MQKSKYIVAFVMLTFLFITESNAYQLFGYKWSTGAYNYYINPIGVDNSTDYSSYSSGIISAASQWTSVSTTNVAVNYMGTTSSTE